MSVSKLRPQQPFGRRRSPPQLTRAVRRVHDATIERNLCGYSNLSESPLPLWERDRVRGLAPAGADESINQLGAYKSKSLRAAARVPSPCPSPTRGEGTLQQRLAPIAANESLPSARM
jgi:hypothetical protein